MKKVLYFLVFLTLGSSLFISCSKDEVCLDEPTEFSLGNGETQFDIILRIENGENVLILLTINRSGDTPFNVLAFEIGNESEYRYSLPEDTTLFQVGVSDQKDCSYSDDWVVKIDL